MEGGGRAFVAQKHIYTTVLELLLTPARRRTTSQKQALLFEYSTVFKASFML